MLHSVALPGYRAWSRPALLVSVDLSSFGARFVSDELVGTSTSDTLRNGIAFESNSEPRRPPDRRQIYD